MRRAPVLVHLLWVATSRVRDLINGRIRANMCVQERVGQQRGPLGKGARQVPRQRVRNLVRQVCFALAVSVTPVFAQTNVLPPLAEDVAAQFPAVGRLGPLGFATQGCSATLIAPDLVVTAAHCISSIGRSGNVFAVGWANGRAITTRAIAIETRHPGYAPDGTHTPANDIGLIVLNAPIEQVAPIPLGQASAQALDGVALTVLGYHVKSPNALTGDFTCATGTFRAGLLHLGCPVINGNSGGPVLRPTPEGGWQLVGVISSRLGAGAIAVELPEWLRAKVAAHQQR